jgi:hypothetical protein
VIYWRLLAAGEFRPGGQTTPERYRGFVAFSGLPLTMANLAAKQAGLAVAKAQLTRAAALPATAKIKLGYTKVKADRHGGDDQRVVAERYVDEGHTVAANAPLLLIVESSISAVSPSSFSASPATLIPLSLPG